MPAGLTRVDASPTSAVVVCGCGYRSGAYPTRTAADAAAQQHRHAVHPRQASNYAAQQRSRSRRTLTAAPA